jgi:hypothetical protein
MMAEDIRSLVAHITEEVIKRLNAEAQADGGTLAVFAGYVFDAAATAAFLREKQGDVTCALLDGVQFEYDEFNIERITDQRKGEFAGRLKGFERIVLVTPPLGLLHAVAQGDDPSYAVMLALRPLLWGRELTMLLDFKAPGSRRSPAFARIAEDIDALEGMGIKIACLPQGSKKGEEARELVTEQDIKDACKSESRRIRIKPGAIVTQLAQDSARELGVSIEV